MVVVVSERVSERRRQRQRVGLEEQRVGQEEQQRRSESHICQQLCPFFQEWILFFCAQCALVCLSVFLCDRGLFEGGYFFTCSSQFCCGI